MGPNKQKKKKSKVVLLICVNNWKITTQKKKSSIDTHMLTNSSLLNLFSCVFWGEKLIIYLHATSSPNLVENEYFSRKYQKRPKGKWNPSLPPYSNVSPMWLWSPMNGWQFLGPFQSWGHLRILFNLEIFCHHASDQHKNEPS